MIYFPTAEDSSPRTWEFDSAARLNSVDRFAQLQLGVELEQLVILLPLYQLTCQSSSAVMSDLEPATTGHETLAPAETVDQTSSAEATQQPSAVNGTAEAGPSTTPAEPPNQPNGDVEVNGSTPPNEPNGDQEPKPTEAEADEPDLSQLFAARREEELARRDRSLAEFLVMLDGYKPLVRDWWSRSRSIGDKGDIVLIMAVDTGRSHRILSAKSRLRLFGSEIVSRVPTSLNLSCLPCQCIIMR